MAAAKILYIGFGELMRNLQGNLSANKNVEFKEILQLGSGVHENLLAAGDVFLIGPYTLDPVKQVQRASQQNRGISIILLIFPDQFQKIKQAVQFAYNVSKHLTFVAYNMGKDITTVLDNAVLRAQQRTSFLKISEISQLPKASHPDLTFKNLSVFLEKAPISAVVFDSDKNIITANFKAQQLFYPKLNAAPGANWNDLFPDEQSALPALPPVDGEEPAHEIIKVNSQFLEINISPLIVETSKPQYLLLMNDVTEKINAENQLKSKIDELEFLNRELDDFINVISHDFKTPLTSIGLLAEMGIKESNQEKQVNFLKQIKQSSNKLREMLKGLNVLVDIKKTKSEKVDHVDFKDRLDFITGEYAETLRQIGGELRADFSAAPGLNYFTAHIDSFFSNLITNAIKYRNPGVPLLIEVKSRREKEYTILTVKDNGTGIDLAKNMNKLFQPFKRLTDQGTGSGLGLSIVKRAIENCQGYLEVYSEPGRGTEFKAYLKTQE